MALAARNDWLDRALSKAASNTESMEAARGLTALALVPFKPEPYYAPIDASTAETVVVDVEPMELYVSSPEEFVRVSEYVWHVRHQMVNPTEHGRIVEVTALLQVGAEVRRVVFKGNEAAIRQALPDREAIAAWKKAGALEVPTWDLTAQSGTRRLKWVPVEQMPVVLQMEYKSRAERPEVVVLQ